MGINQTSSYGATGPIPMQMEHRGKTYSVLNASYLMTATDAEPGAVDTVTTDELQHYSPDSRTTISYLWD